MLPRILSEIKNLSLLNLSQKWVASRQVFWKHWEKEKLLMKSSFSFSPTVFYPFGKPSALFIKLDIVVCKLFQFGSVQNFVVF